MELLFQLPYLCVCSGLWYKMYFLEGVRKVWNLPVHLHLRMKDERKEIPCLCLSRFPTSWASNSPAESISWTIIELRLFPHSGFISLHNITRTPLSSCWAKHFALKVNFVFLTPFPKTLFSTSDKLWLSLNCTPNAHLVKVLTIVTRFYLYSILLTF